jgi:hypothetical protein
VFKLQARSIYSGFAFAEGSLLKLWHVLESAHKSLHDLAKELIDKTIQNDMSFPLLIFSLFCDSAVLLFSTLDNTEIYEIQRHFKLTDISDILSTVNRYCLALCQYNAKNGSSHLTLQQSMFKTANCLLTVLLEMNDRKAFTTTSFIAKPFSAMDSSKFKTLIFERDQEALSILNKMPHCIPFHLRADLFKELVIRDKRLANPRNQKLHIKIRRHAVIPF